MVEMTPGEDERTPQQRNPEAFPNLSDRQIRLIAEVGEKRHFKDGDDVWRIGLPMTSFFVVVRGAVEVFQTTGTGEEHRVVLHQPGEFTGDIDLLSSSATVVGARAHGRTETIEVAAERLRKLVVENSELSDVILAAGDVRSGSTKRVASAVGEGSIAVSFIHQVLAEQVGSTPGDASPSPIAPA